MSEEVELHRLDDDGAPHPPMADASTHASTQSEASASMAETDKVYWEAFEDNLLRRLGLLQWAPFRALKIFKVGLHWVTVYRSSAYARNVQYWVAITWQAAFRVANEVASTVRKEFEPFYARPF
jgi:hypothetical protein